MKNTCLHCRRTFEITADDLAFYEKISPDYNGKKELIPPPTHCPDCRRQRRLSFRNERTLYHRKCDLSGKQIISNFAPDAPFRVYAHEEWWSDKWDAREYGRNVDFSRPFFEQIVELERDVPHLALSVWNSQNSDYCNYVGNVKDSYLIFGSVYSEDCYYGSPYYSKNCVDTLLVRECERCYECVDCRKLYECLYCRDCHSSRNLLHCFDLQGCHDCIGCAGLRKKQYCVGNRQLTKEEFHAFRASLDLFDPSVHDRLRNDLAALSLSIPHRYMQSNQVEHVSGNYVFQSKNVPDSYYADRCEDCRYCAQVVDLKDCHDNNYTEENELCYEYLGAYQVSRVLFSRFCNKVSESMYANSCFNARCLFGCSGIRSTEYCILNKQYTAEEYASLLPKIVELMKQHGEWGEFYPVRISHFGYNETVAQEYFPLRENDAKSAGWQWRPDDLGSEKYLGPPAAIPRRIEDVGDDICKQILLCEATERPYKIIPQELQFYRDMHLPVPRLCPDERHRRRMQLRNPRHLWKRPCMKCGTDMETTYAPERPEIVYCEECYLSSIY